MGTKLLQALGRNAPYVSVLPAPIIAQRAPATTDTDYAKGQPWIDESVSPPVMYAHNGGGVWTANNLTLSTDGTFAAALDTTASSSLAIKTYVDATAVAGAPNASTSVKGIVEEAESAEVNAGTAVGGTGARLFVNPGSLSALFASPPAIGGTSEAAGTFSTLAATGAIDFDAGGSFESGGTAINIGADASADAINIGTGAAARVITIGNVTGASQVVLNSGTAGIAMASTGAGDITIDSDDTLLLDADGVLELNSSAGAISIGNDANAQAINIGTGAAARTITMGNGTGATSLVLDCGTGALNIGTNAIAHTVTIGNVTGATAIAMNVGTGNFALEGNVASTYAISNVGVNTGQVDIAGGTGARTINLGGGGTGAKTINIGAAASADVITIGTSDGAGSLTLGCGTGNFSLEGATASTYAISNVGVNTGQVDIAGGTGARTINLGGGGTGAKTINVGAAASADVITIGTSDGAGSLTLGCGTGNFSLEGATASTYAISNVGVNTGQVDIAGGTGARTINLGGGGTGAKTINIGAAASADVITIGTSDGAGSLTLGCGTGNFSLEGATASTYAISNVGVNTGQVDIAGGTGARTINLGGGGTGAKTINIGAAASADVITIGTTDGASSLSLAAGTGDISFSGTVKEIDAEFLYSSGTDLVVSQSPIVQSNANTGAAPTGAGGDVNLMYMQDGCLMEQFMIGTQTIIAPRMTANGLNLALDNTAADGVEYNFGARNNAKHAYTIGTSAAFFIEAQIYVQDLSGCDPLMVGFRKVEANNATFASYTDYVGIGLNQATSATNVVILDELNSGGQTATDSTDAWGGDGSSQTVKVLVSASGVVTFEVGGSAASAAPAYTFDNTDVVMPYIHFVQGADVTSEVSLVSLKIGFQA
jgi:hypothetical protein